MVWRNRCALNSMAGLATLMDAAEQQEGVVAWLGNSYMPSQCFQLLHPFLATKSSSSPVPSFCWHLGESCGAPPTQVCGSGVAWWLELPTEYTHPADSTRGLSSSVVVSSFCHPSSRAPLHSCWDRISVHPCPDVRSVIDRWLTRLQY